MLCPRCGQSYDPQARFCQSCGYDFTIAKPSVVSQAKYAGFWKRAAAILIDSFIISVATGLLAAGTMGLAWFSILLWPWLYEALMISSEKQATLGKMALGIVVTDIAGNRISFGRATARHFAKWLSALILGIGFLMAAFTERKQALHDMIADTLVVNRPPAV